MLREYGLPALKSLYTKYVRPHVDKFMGGDEGINSIDWGAPLAPFRFSPVGGENVDASGIKPCASQSASFKTVDPYSIKSTVCPELYRHRYSYTETMKTAVAYTIADFSIVSNMSGNVGVVVFPLSNSVDGTQYLKSFVSIFNDSTFNPSTGVQTPSAAFSAGPLYSSSASIESLRTTNFSLQLIPTASFNTAGYFTLGYNNRWGATYLSSTSVGSNLAQLKNFPFVTTINTKTYARMINVTGDSADETFTSIGTGNVHQGFVIIGTGLPAGIEVCRLSLTVTAEFIPSLSGLPICLMDYPRPGPLTENFESMMFMRFPVLQQLTLTDAKRVADTLPDFPYPFDELFNILGRSLTGITPVSYLPHMFLMNNPIAMEGMKVMEME
jgi:hypothetical protein